MAGDKSILQTIGKELKSNPPKILSETAKKYGVARAQRQKKAIMLNKSRRAGASVSYKKF